MTNNQTWAKKKALARARISKLKSGFERTVLDVLLVKGIEVDYEVEAVPFTPAPKTKTFDFWVTTRTGKRIVIECKGPWLPEVRRDECLAIEQNPQLDVRYVFMRDQPIRRGSKTRYSDFCHKKGILCAFGGVPDAWLDE